VLPLDDHEQVIATTLLGTLHGSYFAYRHFLERQEPTRIGTDVSAGRREGRKPAA